MDQLNQSLLFVRLNQHYQWVLWVQLALFVRLNRFVHLDLLYPSCLWVLWVQFDLFVHCHLLFRLDP